VLVEREIYIMMGNSIGKLVFGGLRSRKENNMKKIMRGIAFEERWKDSVLDISPSQCKP
jgi:hypothetical protein